MTQESKLGMFVLAGIACLVVSILTLGDIQFKPTYNLYILYDDVAGLPNKAKVKIAGVEVGGVKNISLSVNKAKVKIWLDPNVKVYANAKAKIVSTGIIGSKYMDILPGTENQPVLKDGDSIMGINPLSFDRIIEDAMGQLSKIVKAFDGLEGSDLGTDLVDTVNNLKHITESLRVAVYDKGNRVSDIVGNLESFTTDLAEVSRDSKTDLKASIKEIRGVAEKLNKLLAGAENKESTIGKLMTDKQMGDDLKETFAELKETSKEAKRALKRINLIETSWDYTMRYDADYGSTRNDAGLMIKPKSDKFYFLGVSNAGDSDSEVDNKEKANTLNLLLGKELGPLKLYGGVIRSKGGVGMRVNPFWNWNPMKRVELTAEGYDFSRKTPVNKPKYNVGIKIKVNKWIYVGSQLEDPYHQSAINSYVNLTVRDDDIAYILGLVTLAK